MKRNYDDGTATVSQKRFLVGDPSSVDSHEYSWWIPLTFASPNQGFDTTYSKEWLAEGKRSRKISGMPGKDTPVVFNVQQTGYYR